MLDGKKIAYFGKEVEGKGPLGLFSKTLVTFQANKQRLKVRLRIVVDRPECRSVSNTVQKYADFLLSIWILGTMNNTFQKCQVIWIKYSDDPVLNT